MSNHKRDSKEVKASKDIKHEAYMRPNNRTRVCDTRLVNKGQDVVEAVNR
jgi:hypothetical protein